MYIERFGGELEEKNKRYKNFLWGRRNLSIEKNGYKHFYYVIPVFSCSCYNLMEKGYLMTFNLNWRLFLRV